MRKRVYSIVGHFGSGKTEFAVNYALNLRKACPKVAILDMDIANPYFRSRERLDLMKENDIAIYFNSYGYDISEDLPAITAQVRAPLENKECITVVDIGGNDSGARIINQFQKYFLEADATMLAVLNVNRPDTENVDLCIEQIKSIELETGVKIEGIINNTHMLMETETEDIINGYRICTEVSEKLGIPVVANTCVEPLMDALKGDAKAQGIETDVIDIASGELLEDAKDCLRIYPLTLQMRPSWLDVEL